MRPITRIFTAAILAQAFAAMAAPYPEHSVTWVVPFAPGGAGAMVVFSGGVIGPEPAPSSRGTASRPRPPRRGARASE